MDNDVIVVKARPMFRKRNVDVNVDLEVMERAYVSPQGEPLRAVAVVLTCPSGARGVGTMVCSPTDVFSLKFGLQEARKKAYTDLVIGTDRWLDMRNALDRDKAKGFAQMQAEFAQEQTRQKKIKWAGRQAARVIRKLAKELKRCGLQILDFDVKTF